MFRYILKYELRSWFKSPVVYIFGLVFFSLALIMMLGTGGYFDGVEETNTVVRLLNSEHELVFIFQYFNKFLLFLIPVLVGGALYKDYESRIHTIAYSFPIDKNAYIFGKLVSSLLVTIIISLLVGLGLFLGEQMLGVANPKIGAFQWSGYFAAYIYFVIPNTLIFGLLLFSLVGWTRNIYTAFIGLLILFLIQLMVENIFHNNKLLYALFDPFGQHAFQYLTSDWTLVEQNEKAIVPFGIIGWNRILWLSISSIVFFIFHKTFVFQYEQPFLFKGVSFFNKKVAIQNRNNVKVKSISAVTYDYSFFAELKGMYYLAVADFKYIVKSWMFVLFSFFGVFTIGFILLRMTNTGEFNLWPLTRLLLSAPLSIYMLIVMLATFIYAGLLIHRAKSQRMNLLIDVTTTPDWSLLGAKVTALSMMQLSFLFLMMLAGISIQLYNSYYDFEFNVYLFHLIIIAFPALFIWIIISVFIHNLIPNLYLGLFALLFLWIGFDNVSQIGINTKLLHVNPFPTLTYSDFNGYASQLNGQLLISLYWIFAAMILLLITRLLWRRGIDRTILQRFKLVSKKLSTPLVFYLFIFISSFLLLGFQVYKGELKEEERRIHGKDKKQLLENFKANFNKYTKIVQPRISNIKWNLNIHPETKSFNAQGDYTLVNKSAKPIDTLLVRTGFDEITTIKIKRAHQIIEADSFMKYTAYKLTTPLLSGDSMALDFEIESSPNTIFTRNSNVLTNGTYIKQDVLPRLGYIFDTNIKAPTDTTAQYNNFYYSDADFVDIETIISTTSSQVAIAPGALVSESKEQDRGLFHFKTRNPIKFNFSFHSADYHFQSEVYKDVTLEVYTHPNHVINTKDMIDGVKAALDYNTKWFGKYPHDKIRIIEFPHTEESYSATLMSNNIPTSEVIFTINKEAMRDKFNLPFYVMAHELTHEWFGNQVMPANALGAKLLTESLTEYISLNIYKEKFGKKASDKFLKLQHNRYLNGRRNEVKVEKPLSEIRPDQEYIAYGKGAIVLNTIAHYVGEEKLNDLVKIYFQKYQNNIDYFPTSKDFLSILKNEIDTEYQYLIDELFEEVVLHENSILDAKRQKGMIVLTLSMKKYNAISKEEIKYENEFLEVGLLDKSGKVLESEKFKLNTGNNSITIADRVGVVGVLLDPNQLQIEINRKNNEVAF